VNVATAVTKHSSKFCILFESV